MYTHVPARFMQNFTLHNFILLCNNILEAPKSGADERKKRAAFGGSPVIQTRDRPAIKPRWILPRKQLLPCMRKLHLR